MSAVGQITQLQQDLQNELTTSNQLLSLISNELRQIKQFTNPGEVFEGNLKQNADLVKTLARLQKVDIEQLPPLIRKDVTKNQSNHNLILE